MLVGGQTARPHLRQQVGEAGVTGHLDPQHQGVDEKADQVIQRGVAPPGDREAHRHLAAGADLRQQHRQGGLDHHEAGRIVLTGHPGNLLLQLGRPVHLHGGAALIGNQRIGPIGGQLQPLGHPGQGFLPVGQLRGDGTVAVVEIPKLRALPQRVVDILHRQCGPPRCLPRTPAGIRHAQITHQRAVATSRRRRCGAPRPPARARHRRQRKALPAKGFRRPSQRYDAPPPRWPRAVG